MRRAVDSDRSNKAPSVQERGEKAPEGVGLRPYDVIAISISSRELVPFRHFCSEEGLEFPRISTHSADK